MLGLPSWMNRNRLVNIKFGKGADSGNYEPAEVHAPNTFGDINAVTSEIIDEGGNVIGHYPVLDLDVQHFYVESSTPGHAHLVIAKALSKEQYDKLLRVLNETGIIQDGVLEGQWKAHNHTAMRLPKVKKGL